MLGYNYFNKHYKIIGIDLSKQEAHDTNPKAIQQINFNGNRNRPESATVFFTIETILEFSRGTVTVSKI